MADEIRQEFVFDAQQALKNIEKLTSQYEKLNTILRSHAKVVKGLNAGTRKITDSLVRIKNAAKSAADQLSRVYGTKAATAAKSATAAASVSPPVDSSKVNEAKASLKELDAVARRVFAGAPIKNQKDFNRGVNDMVLAFHRGGGSAKEFQRQLLALDSKVNGTQTRMRTAMRNIAKATKDGTNTRPLADFVVSWQTMVRIISTQLIVRGLNVLRQAFRDALQGALDYNRAIAEIGTIANGAYGPLNDIAKIVRETSDAYGKSRLDVAEGLYQTLSNQVGTAAETLNVFETANKLSITAVGTTEDAVNLLTAALNSFDISTTEADATAAKLFRTVELGRTRMSELANTLGRVGPLANALGVSFDETLAAIATITVQGTKTAEALTQLRGVMQGMIKPSEDMKKVFQEIGVTSAEAGVATFGFQGFLDEMTKVTGKSTTEMGKLIRRVRGLLGAVTLAGEDTEKFIENLQKLEDTTADLLDQKFKLVFETPGEELLREFNKLKNILVVDVGSALVSTTLSVVKFAKALGRILPSITAFAQIIVIALIPRMATWIAMLTTAIVQQVKLTLTSVLGWTKTGITIKGATIALGNYLKALALTNVAVAGVIIALVGIAYAIDQSNKKYVAQIRVMRDARLAQIEYQKTLDIRKIETYSKLDGKLAEVRKRRILSLLVVAQKTYNEQRIAAESADTKEVESAKDKFNSLSKLLEDYTSKAQKKLDNLAKNREDSEKRVGTIAEGLESDRFDRNIRLYDAQKKLDVQRSRGLKLQREASKFLVTGDPEKIKRGLKLYQESRKIFDDIRDIAWDQLRPLEEAWRSGNRSADVTNKLQLARNADNAANRLSVNLSRDQLKAEQALQQVLDRRSAKAKLDVDRQKEINAKFKSQFDIILDNMKTLDKEGKLLDEKTLADQLKTRSQAFEQIRILAGQTIGGLDLAELLRLTTLKTEIENAFSPTAIQLNEGALNTASNRVKDAFLQGMNEASIEWATTVGKIVIPSFEPSRGFSEVQKLIQDMSTDQTAIRDKQLEINRVQIEYNKSLKDARVLLRAAGEELVPQFATGRYKAQAEQILWALAQQVNSRDLTLEQKAALEDLIAKWRGLKSSLAGVGSIRLGGGMIEDSALAYDKVLATMSKVGSLRLELDALNKEFGLLGGLDKQTGTEAFLKHGAQQQTDLLKAGTESLQKRMGIIENKQLPIERALTDEVRKREGYEASILKLRQAYMDAPAIIRKQQQAAALNPVGMARGGLVKSLMYLAKGNLARGTDTIPAMLSPGEFVMNSKSTRRFHSQLVAMNRGQQPIYRESGGPVTNVTIGDINVRGGETAVQTGRQICGAIKREMRRGTSSF